MSDVNPSIPVPAAPSISWRALANNMITRMGLISVAFWGLTLLFFIFRDITSNTFEDHPYAGLLIYLLLPGLFWASVIFAAAGIFLKWRHIKTHPEEARNTIMLRPVAKKVMAVGLVLTATWLLLSGFGAYKSYHYTATTSFCGTACHVMEPEHVAYENSIHDKVSCPQCHVGTGLQSSIQAKTNGIKQLWEVATQTYHTPIKTPIANERPTQGTCGQCHAPERMRGEITRTRTHFSTDAENTPIRYKLLMNVAGGMGVHWHVSDKFKISFFATDAQYQDIPYVRMTKDDGSIVEYIAPKFDKATVVESKLRTMTCTDCHNRVGHDFKPPKRAIDAAMDSGEIPTSIPMFKRVTSKALEEKYSTSEEATAKIGAAIDEYYKGNPPPPAAAALLPAAKEAVLNVYRRNFFPERDVDYRGFNDNLGHYDFKGCERCHDQKHATADKSRNISMKCDVCHTLIGQATGADEIQKMTLGKTDFKHPEEEVSQKKTCSSCHALKKE